MPYMKNDTISQLMIEDSIEISDAQYQLILTAKLEGKPVTVRNGQPFIYSGGKRTVYRMVGNVIESQEILTENDTPAGWQDTKPTPNPEQVKVITRRQGRLALRRENKLLIVESAINNIVDDDERVDAKIEYEADTWELDNPFLQSMWNQLGGTEQELNDLFTLANTL